MLRRTTKLVTLLVCCSFSFLLPIFISAAGTYRNIPRKYQSTIDSPLEANFERYIKSRRSRRVLATTDRTSFVVYDISKDKKISINQRRSTDDGSLAH